MNEREDLYDPAKPYARFYQAAAGGIVAQVHTRRIEGLGFPRVGWNLTASCSDDDGATLRTEDDALQILQAPDGQTFTHQLIFQFDSAADVAAELEAARRHIAGLALNAAEVWRAASEVGV